MDEDNKGCLWIGLIIFSIYIFSFFVNDLPENLNWVKAIFKGGKFLFGLLIIVVIIVVIFNGVKDGVENISNKLDANTSKKEMKLWLKECKKEFKGYLYNNNGYGSYKGNLPDTLCKVCEEPFYAQKTFYHSCGRCYDNHNSVVGYPNWEMERFQKNLKEYSIRKYFNVHESWLSFKPKQNLNFEDKKYLKFKNAHKKMMLKVIRQNKKINEEFNQGKEPYKERLKAISSLLHSATNNDKYEYNRLLRSIDKKPYSYINKSPYSNHNYEVFDGGVDIGGDY